MLGEDITDNTILFETETDPDTGEITIVDTPENKSRASKIADWLADTFGGKVGKALLAMILLGSGAALTVFIVKVTIGCDLAKTNSGCFAIDPVNSKLQRVDFTTNTNPECTDYKKICGGCLKGFVQPGKAAECCSSAVDTIADKRKGWNYTLRCTSPEQAMLDTLKGIGDALNPATILTELKKLLMILLYAAIAVVGVVVVFYLIKFSLSRFKRGDKHSV